jgi:hypothetical protein
VLGCTGTHPPEKRNKIIRDNNLCPFCLLHGADEICYSKIYGAKPAYQAPECKELHINWLHRIMLPHLARQRPTRVV